jgi:hypothetical protein
MIQKIVNKSKSFWKHGKHGGMLGIAIAKNKERSPREKLEVIDTSKPDWSKK